MAVARRSDGTIEQITESIFGGSGKPRVVLRFALVDDRIECVRVEIGARFDSPSEPDPRPLTTGDLRKVDLGRLIARSKADRVRALERLAAERRWPNETRQAARRELMPARASLLKYDPRKVAEVYRKAWDSGDPNPTKAVAKHFRISASAAGKRVWKARHEFGLLPKTEPGKASARRRGGRRRS